MGLVRRNKNKEYYAVISGRVDRPTIFTSWGDVHPRVTGCPAVYASFNTIEQAYEYMAKKQVEDYDKVIKDTALDTTPVRGSIAYYAVAYGKQCGIHTEWYGSAKKEVHQFPGACHKRFRTRAQAEAFIEDWKESYAEVWCKELKTGLDKGLRPADMKLDLEGTLRVGQKDADVEDLIEVFDEKLGLN